MQITAADALLALKAMPRRRHRAKAIAEQLGIDSTRAVATALRGQVGDGRVTIKYRDGIGRYKFVRLSRRNEPQ